MKSKNSLKVKLIIFIVAALIGIGCVAYNYRNSISLMIVPKGASGTADQSKITASDSKSNEEAQKKQQEDAEKAKEDAAKQAEQEKQQKLEDEWQKGYAAYNDRNYKQAITTMDDIISQDANFYKAYTTKGIALAFSGKYDLGMQNLNKALEIKSDYGYGRYNKALALELYGHYDEAIAEYNQALDVEKYVWSYYGIASIYGRYGDAANSVKYLNIAISMNPDVKACAREEKDFNNVRNSQAFQDAVK